ncbi:MAG: TadE/TadG family type IV pilus assembly protein, partial [Cypionkella sp.]
MRHAFCFLRRFAGDARGNMSVEAMLMLPVLVWALIAFFSFWDVYRINYLAKKATFTIADVISRERAQISAAFAYRYGTVFAYALERPIPLTASNSKNQPIVIR